MYHLPVWVAVVLMAAITTLAALLLLAPVRVKARMTDEGSELCATWLLCGLRYDFRDSRRSLSLLRWKFRLRGPAAAKRKRRKRPKKARVRVARGLTKGLLEKIVSNLGRILRRLLRTVRIRRFRAMGSLATPDPALTGMLFGLVPAFRQAARLSRVPMSVDIVPDFVHDRPTGALDAEITTRLWDWVTFLVFVARCLTLKEIVRAYRKRKKRR